jgi:hypothetical protein
MKVSLIGLVLAVIAPVLPAQDASDWDDIHFETGSSAVVDGVSSLIRLAKILDAHRDLRVELTGYTDSVEAPTAAQKLSLARAEAVKAYLVAHGANAEQIVARGSGSSASVGDNSSREGRFRNRRVSIAIRDAQGRIFAEGGVSDFQAAVVSLHDQLQETADQTLKRLDKLDDLLASNRQLQGESERLESELADLRNQNNMLRDQLASLPKPVTEMQTTEVVRRELEAELVREKNGPAAWWTGGLTGRAFLIGKESEDPKYGLFSYILISRKPATSEKDLKKKYLAVLDAYQSGIDTLDQLANQPKPPPPSQINVTYLPLQFLPGKITSEKLLEANNAALAATLIKLLITKHPEVEKGDGPFIASYKLPLTAAQRIEDRHLFIDMSRVPADAAALYVKAFRIQSSREKFWEDDRFILDCYSFIENAGGEFARVGKEFKDKTYLSTIFEWFK